jgi:hypothetical protein
MHWQGALLLALEARLCPRQALSVGIILGRGVQTSEEEMMANADPSSSFQRFLKIIQGPDRDPSSHGTHWKGEGGGVLWFCFVLLSCLLVPPRPNSAPQPRLAGLLPRECYVWFGFGCSEWEVAPRFERRAVYS